MKTIFTILFLFTIHFSFAQTNDPYETDPYEEFDVERTTTNPDLNYDWAWKTGIVTAPPPPPVPIDGGLGILLAVGIGYGLRKLKKH